MNYKKIFLLLLLFIPFSVSAAEIPSGPIKVSLSGNDNVDSNFGVSPIYYTHSSSNMYKKDSYYITKRCIDSDGTNKAEDSGRNFYGAYRIRYYNSTRYVVTYKGDKYAAVCVDKGLTANHSVVCSPYEDSAISYVFANYQDRLMATDNTRLAPELAIRALSVDKGLSRDLNSVLGMQAIHDSVAGTPSGAGEYLLEVVRTQTGSKDAYVHDASLVTFANNSGTVLDEARSIYSAAQSHSGGSPSETLASLGEDVKYTITKSGSDTALTYIITFDRAIAADKVKVEVKGATSSSYAMVGKVLTINITRTETQCNIQIEIKFEDGAVVSDELSSSLFLCTSENNKGQSYLVQMEAPTPGTIIITNNDLCECDCPPYNEIEHIQMCCTDNEPSEVIEPFIKDLFCDYKPSDEILVNGFTSGCGTQYEISSSLTGLPSDNIYCELYCTERIHVTIPDAVSSVVGMYFDLTPVNSQSKGPLFKGKRTCRELIHYDEWVEEYVNQSQIALTNFNTSQQNLAYKKMYDDAITKILNGRSGEGNVSGTAYYSCSGNAPSGCLDSSGSQQGSIDLSESVGVTCGYKYQGKAYSTDYLKYVYPKAKSTLKFLDNKDSLKQDSYKGFEAVVNDPATGNSHESSMPTGLYHVEWKDNDCGSASTVSASTTITCYAKCTPLPGQTTCQMSSSSETVSNGSCGNRTISRDKPADIQSSFDGSRSTVTDIYTTAISAYDTAVDKLTKLEEYYKQCDEFYDDATLGAAKQDAQPSDKNGPAYKMYSISPTVEFHYFQAHVENTNQMITPKETIVPFDVKCEHRLKKIDSAGDLSVPGDETELGLEEPHYNTKNGNEEAQVKSFNAKSIDYVGLNAATGSVLKAIDATYVKYNQRYTHDAYYEDICYSNDDATGSYNVYPYGSISDSGSTYYSTHDVSYYIEYSTLFANYETYWEFSSVGMDGRFDKNFTEHGTCSGNTNYDAPRLFCSLHVDSELTEISGCSQDAIIAFLDGFSNNWEDECCDGGDCKNRSTDELTYTFKIVDSANLFPDGGYATNDHSSRYGYNWLEDTNGIKVLNEIQKRANHPSKNDDVYSDNNITFEFNLSSQDLALVKEYNSSHAYNDFDMTCKPISGGGDKVLRVEECKSNFLTHYYEEGRIITNNDASVKLGKTKLDNIRTSNPHFHYYYY